MATASLSPLAKKLFIKPGHRVGLINAPAGYAELLEPLPAGTAFRDPATGGLDALLLFVNTAAEVDRLAPGAASAVKPGALLWYCYRKGGTKAGTDLNRDLLHEQLERHGLTGVSLISVDDTWSAMRFRTGAPS